MDDKQGKPIMAKPEDPKADWWNAYDCHDCKIVFDVRVVGLGLNVAHCPSCGIACKLRSRWRADDNGGYGSRGDNGFSRAIILWHKKDAPWAYQNLFPGCNDNDLIAFVPKTLVEDCDKCCNISTQVEGGLVNSIFIGIT